MKIYLDRNENHYGPAPECIEALMSISLGDLTTYTREYVRGVKSSLSEHLAIRYGIPEQQVLLSYGSEDMLKQIVHCYLGPERLLMVPQYSWWYYKAVANEVGGSVLEYPLRHLSDRFDYEVGNIHALVRARHPAVVLFASPNNPTGNTLSTDALRELLTIAPDALVVIDEAYFGFGSEPDEMIPQLILTYPQLAVLRTFSKLYGLAGLRIGFACVGARYERLVRFSARYLGYNALSERLALAALNNPRYYKEIGNVIATERKQLIDLFSQINGCTAYASEANFVLVKIPAEHINGLQKYLNENDFIIKYFSEPEFTSHVRITIGTEEENQRLIKIIGDFFH